MGDLEFFGGMDGGGESDPAAFERFKERMKAAAAQLKAIQKQEQKQKKSEDELIKILLKFIQSGKKKDILLLVVRLLEQNVPSGFVVGLLLISNRDIQQELKMTLLPPSISAQEKDVVASYENNDRNLPERYMGDQVLPLRIKISIANWINEIQKFVNDNPQKVIKTTLNPDSEVELTPIQLGAFCLRDFLDENKVENDYKKLKEFVSFFLNDIINKAKMELKDRKELTGDVD
jgi:hypothetical protein